MRKFLGVSIGVCIVALLVTAIHTITKASTSTPNLSLTLPSVGEAGWGPMINGDFTTLDTQFGSTTAGHEHLGTTGEGPKIALTTAVSGTLPVANGGTAGTTAAAARSALGAAASGANTDITSLKGLTGNAIGIGTATPQNSIHVHKTTDTFSNMNFTNSVTGSSSINDGGRVGIDSNEFMTVVGGSGTNGIKFFTNNAEVATISNDGYLGIGTDTPAVALHLNGTTLAETSMETVTASNSESMQLITARGRAGPATVQNGDTLGFWSFRGYDGSAYSGSQASIKANAIETWSGTAHGTEIIFSTTPNASTTLTQAMVINHNAFVGIGDATPLAALTVGNGDDFQVSDVGAVTTNNTINSTATGSLGWTVQNSANQACNTTCTSGACVVGINTDSFGAFLPCTNTSADSCLCSG